MFHRKFNIRFRRLVLLEMNCFEKIIKRALQKFADFSRLGLRSRRLSIRRNSARFRKIIVLLFNKLITKLVTFLNLSVDIFSLHFSSRVRSYVYRRISATYGSILGSVILCRTFRRISQPWDDAHTPMVGEMVQNSQSLNSFTFNAVYCYSRIYLFTFSNRVYVQKIYLFAFNGVLLIHDYIYSHLGDVFIHIQRVIFIHIHDRNMVGEMVQNSQSLYSFSIFCAPSLRIIRS